MVCVCGGGGGDNGVDGTSIKLSIHILPTLLYPGGSLPVTLYLPWLIHSPIYDCHYRLTTQYTVSIHSMVYSCMQHLVLGEGSF